MKAIKGSGTFSLEAADMCLVPGVKILTKFKVLVFEKYKGFNFPMTHVQSYYRNMVAYSDNEKLLIHFSRIASVGLHRVVDAIGTYTYAHLEGVG